MLNLILLPAAAAVTAIAFAALAVIWAATRRLEPDAEPEIPRAVFLMDDLRIVDATEAGRDYLDALTPSGTEGAGRVLFADLARRFTGLSEARLHLAEGARERLTSRDGTGTLLIEREGSRLRLTLSDAADEAVSLDRGSHSRLLRELDEMRTISNGLPHALWRQDADGRITWVNRAYLDLAEALTDTDRAVWPPQPLFDLTQLRKIEPNGDGLRRTRIDDPQTPETAHWFEVHLEDGPQGTFGAALPADTLVKAERSLQTFVQTLSQTFAQLSVGLAVFDRGGRLAMFNPALGDLTTLPIDVLLSRPTLGTFLDQLRARSMMPEPKDYRSWRDRIADLERTAKDGTYAEMWHLPSQQTWRVTGRPQPDGAVALLIEDISAEMGLTRRFRAEVAMSQSVLDSLDEALVVFDRAGNAVLSNAAYDALWETDTAESFAQLGADEALAVWMKASVPSPVWGDARVFIAHDLERADWSGEVRLLDGRGLTCHFRPLAGGATLVRFEERRAARQPLLPPPATLAVQERLKA